MSLERRRTLMKSSIESQSGYCPFVWMFCGRKTNNRTNHLHERTLRIVYNESQSSFENLLRKDRAVSINHRNIRSFAIDIYKIKNNMSTPTMSELFEKRNFFLFILLIFLITENLHRSQLNVRKNNNDNKNMCRDILLMIVTKKFSTEIGTSRKLKALSLSPKSKLQSSLTDRFFAGNILLEKCGALLLLKLEIP